MSSLSLLLLTLYLTFQSGCLGTTLRFLLLSDIQYTPEETYIEKELLPVIQNINFDFLLISGGLIENPNTDPTSQISNLFQKFRNIKNIFWVPSGLEIGAQGNATNFDKNIHKMTMKLFSPGLYIMGYGGTYTATELRDFYQTQSFSETTPSVILLTHEGPSGIGFDTTKIRKNSINDGTTGISNLTDFLTNVQSNVILYLHGNNPQGMGSTNFGHIRIINPGGLRDFRSFSVFDLIQNENSQWELSDWKNYRYGNITNWGGVTTTETCKLVTKTVASPWFPNPYTIGALVTFSIFLVVYVAGFALFVNVGKAQ